MRTISFNPNSLTVKAGKVVIFMQNQDGQGDVHNLALRDSTRRIVVSSDNVAPGTSAVFTIDDLPAGTYTMVCTFDSHESAGMVGTLVANP